MNVILFGAGKNYQLNKERFRFMNIVAIIDNDRNKSGMMLDGIVIAPPEQIKHTQFDYVIIVCSAYEQIRKQLIDLGVSQEKIIDKNHRGIFEKIVSYTSYEVQDGNKDEDKQEIIILTHGLDYSGAPLMLYNAISCLKKENKRVRVFSLFDGPLRFELLRMGVSVIVFRDNILYLQEVKRYITNNAILFVNTMVFYPYIREIDELNIHTIWWIHEEEGFYAERGIDTQLNMQLSNVKVYGVGERVIRAFKCHFPNQRIAELLYGIHQNQPQKKMGCKFIYAQIGTADDCKGLDIFCEAVKKANGLQKEQCEYWIIGEISQERRNEYTQIDGVKVFGSMEHNELMKLYQDIDVLVCPSRNDSMPVVVTEAMMNKKVCIVSDHTGQSQFIVNYKNGLVFESENVDALRQHLEWTFLNQDKLKDIGEEAYQVYEKRFRMNIFENNLSNIMKEIDSGPKGN